MVIALISRKRVSYWWLVALAAAAFFVLRLLVGDGSSGLDRILDGSDSGRSSIYADTVSLIIAHPLGIGWGNLAAYLPQYVPVGSDTLYPHNLFLEMAVEGGWFALVMTVLLVATALVGALIAVRLSNSLWPLVLLGVLAYNIMNSQVSSDVVGNRMMWLYLGFALAFIPAKKDGLPLVGP
jgi:O-antigen ligase